MNRALQALLLCGWSLLAATALTCTPAPARFLAPRFRTHLTLAPLPIDGDVDANADAGSVLILLNGVDISRSFSWDPPAGGRQAFHSLGLFWDPLLLQPGTNELQVHLTLSGMPRQGRTSFDLGGDPWADSVVAFLPGSGAGFGSPASALGPPRGAGLFSGSQDVVTLGLGGVIELELRDNVIVDGPGDDFQVFENAFLPLDGNLFTLPPFAEPGSVSVSQDRVQWFPFACDLAAPPFYAGCAGVYPVLANADDPLAPHGALATSEPIQSLVGQDALALVPPAGAGGDRFDLAQVGLAWARFVRIQAADFATGPVGPGTAGFDLDAVAAVHSAPATDANANGIPDAME